MTAFEDEEQRPSATGEATGEVTQEMGRLADEMARPDISEGHRRALKHQLDEARKDEQRRQARAGEDRPYYGRGEEPIESAGEDITGPQRIGNEPPRSEEDINRETKYKR